MLAQETLMNPIKIDKLPKDHAELTYVKDWAGGDGTIPIYHASTIHAFNRAIGYARFINHDNSTVLYRGQNKLYDSLLPSGARNSVNAVPDSLLEDMAEDIRFLQFCGLNDGDIAGWRQYQNIVLESILQHYGAKTLCMDFVDNHWCALWFGTHCFSSNRYTKREDDGMLYILLYVADTISPSIKGLYVGEDTYTLDLRKVLPSYFQRPTSQHGWMIRDKYRACRGLEDRIIGIIEVSVKDALSWMGTGQLLSEENFFPSFSIDQGYKVLLSRQQRSGIESKLDRLLPRDTVHNYHLSELFYCSDRRRIDSLPKKKGAPEWTEKLTVNQTFELLLQAGWSKNSCEKEHLWDDGLPYIGQSGITALIIQDFYGGDIRYCTFSNGKRTHYFNVIDGIVLDLTFEELPKTPTKDFVAEMHKLAKEQNCKGVNLRSKRKKEISAVIDACYNDLQARFPKSISTHA